MFRYVTEVFSGVSFHNKKPFFYAFRTDFYYICIIKNATMRKILFFCATVLCISFAEAKVTLPRLFQPGMVLQRGKPIPVWGKADAGQTVSVTFNKKQYTTTADTAGNWRLDLPKMKAGGPFRMTVNELVLDSILIGDVWLCSGQSNIDVTIERVYPMYVREIDTYENPSIRLFRVQNETDTHGTRDDIGPTPINWKPLNRQNAWYFSAIGYFLGKRMFEKTGVPQGIIVNSWGGTPIEAWLPADSLRRDFPLLLKRTQLYQNDPYVRAQASANQQASMQWQRLLDGSDPGISQDWTAAGYDDSGWATVDQYATGWAQKNGRGIVGSLWLRQHIHVDKAHAGKPARLLLGTLFDRDQTYLNGRPIGHTDYQYPPRRYDIPEGLLREGDNVLTVRFINKYGTVHFIKEKPYLLAFGDDRFSQNPLPADTLPLSREWKFRPGAEMPACPGGDVALQNLPTTLYNAVLHPLAPYALSGVVWYQGESNAGNPAPYARLLQKLMGGWRSRWNEPRLPFVIVQLANFMEPSEQPQNSGWAQLREAQRTVALADPHAELAVINDLGEAVDIHPLRKKEAAERIALGFDRLVYNNKVKLSPQPVAARTDGNGVVVTLDQPLQPGELHEFEVAGPDGVFRNVRATTRGDGSEVRLDTGGHPVHTVRYAWKNNPARANARSLTGLPMSSFELKLQ